MAPDRLLHQEQPGQVHVDDPLPLLQRQVLGRLAPRLAGIVDQDVDGAVAVKGMRDAVRDAGGLSDVGDDRKTLQTPLLEVSHRRVEILRASPGDDDARACLEVRLGDRLADAAAPARHEGNLTINTEHVLYPHGLSSRSCRWTWLVIRRRRFLGESAPHCAVKITYRWTDCAVSTYFGTILHGTRCRYR